MSTESIKIDPETGSMIRKSARSNYKIINTKQIKRIKVQTEDFPAPVRPQTPIFFFDC